KGCDHTMLDFSRFEILTFDCYGTLINWEEGILRCLHLILTAHGKDIDDATILSFMETLKPALSKVSIAAIVYSSSPSCGNLENTSASHPRTGNVIHCLNRSKNGSRGLTPSRRFVSCRVASGLLSFPMWMTIFSRPLGPSWKWSSARSSLRSSREPTSHHSRFSSSR